MRGQGHLAQRTWLAAAGAIALGMLLPAATAEDDLGSGPQTAPVITAKAPIPSAAEQAAALKDIQEVFKEEYASRGPEGRLALAQKLLAQADDSTGQSPSRYVLYREAIKAGAPLGEVDMVLAAANAIAALYAVDGQTQHLEALDAVLPHARNEALVTLAAAYRTVGDRALTRDDYPGAQKSFTKGANAAAQAKSPALALELQRLAADVSRISTEAAKVAPAREKLKTSPDDPAANAQVGRFLCLEKRDWAQGLPLLAKGDDATLKAIAQAELDPVANLVATADKWWDLGEKTTDAGPQRALRQHAVDLYRQVVETLSGFDRQKAETRIARLEAAARPEARDILSLVKTDKHVISGKWQKSGTSLTTGPGAGSFCLVATPMAPQGDYEVSVDFIATTAKEIAITLPVGEKATTAILHSRCVRLQYINGTSHRPADPTAKSAVTTAALTDKRSHTLTVRVVHKGENANIVIKLDGKEHLTWEGPAAQASTYSSWRVPREVIGFGTYSGSATFSKATVRMLKGTAKVVTDSAMPAATRSAKKGM